MGKNNGESGGLPLFETYNGKKKRIKKSLPSCIHLCPRLWRSLPQNTPLDDTTCGYQKRRGEEDFGERKKKTDTVFFDRAFCWGASTTREPLSLSLYIYIYIDDDEQKNARI